MKEESFLEPQPEEHDKKVVDLAAFARRKSRQEAETPENTARIREAIGKLINGDVTKEEFFTMLQPLHAEQAIPLIEKLREHSLTVHEKKGEILQRKKEIETLQKENNALWNNILNALYDIKEEK